VSVGRSGKAQFSIMNKAYPKRQLTVAPSAAKRLIWLASGVVFLAVVVLNRVKVPAPDGFDVHVFAQVNDTLNSLVSLLLLAGLITAKAGQWEIHRKVMMSALVLSVLFLVSYILHHLFAGDTPYGGQGVIRPVYYTILITHIILAAGSLPFILTTAYRALSANYAEHRSLAKRVWPVWFYVSVSGVVVYLMIRPYYG
jgi:putative membrane protein